MLEYVRPEVDSRGKPFELIVRSDTLNADELRWQLKANGWPDGEIRPMTQGGTVVMRRQDYTVACK